MFVYQNSLGETSWDERQRHVGDLTENDALLIKMMVVHELDDSYSRVISSKGLDKDDPPIQEFVGTDYVKQLPILVQVHDLDTMEEWCWPYVYSLLVKADARVYRNYFSENATKEEYATVLKETIRKVELIAGVAMMVTV